MWYSFNFLRAILGDSFQSTQYYALLDTQTFENEVQRDLARISNPHAADSFFEKHARFIQGTHRHNLQIVGIEMWLTLLNKIYEINMQAYGRIHKGTAYYHAGIMSIISEKYIEGFEWLDYAFDQDIHATTTGNVDSPVVWTLSFDLRSGHPTIQVDFGVTQQIFSKIQQLLQDLHQLDSNFRLTEANLRSKVRSAILTSSSNRVVRAAWTVFLGNIMSRERICRYLNIAPRSTEVQLLAHHTLGQLTQILESLLKKASCASQYGVTQGDALWDLIRKIVPNEWSSINFVSNNSLTNTPIRKEYRHIRQDITSAESVPEDKLAIAFTVAHRVRNLTHHLFNEEYIGHAIFTALFSRICYTVVSVLNKLY